MRQIQLKMEYSNYQDQSKRTFSYRKHPLDPGAIDILHCAIGISTEAGELLDAFKKTIYYGKPLDRVNLGEEIGDLMFYIANLCRLMDLDFNTVLQNNIDKLKVRYPDKFTEHDALNRDLDKEREQLTK